MFLDTYDEVIINDGEDNSNVSNRITILEC